MIKQVLIVLFVLSAFIAEAQTGPGGVGSQSTNILWVKSDSIIGLSNGDSVETWRDISGNSNHLTQTAGEFQPVYVTNLKNGFPGIRFQTINNRLIKNSFSSFPSTSATVFIVNKNNLESDDGIFSYASSTSDNEFLLFNSSNYAVYRRSTMSSSSISGNDNNWHIIDFSWRSSDGSTKLWKDGAQAYSTTLSSGVNITTNGCLSIGAEQDGINSGYVDGQTHNGEFLEIMVFNTELNTTQRIIVANYLAAKYDLTISNDKYSYSSSNGYDVSGIGRYSATDNHTEAQSSRIITIHDASDMTTDGEYLLFGHDNAAINSWSSTGCPTNIKKIGRVWRLDETGDVGTVSFKLDTTHLPWHSSGYTSFGIMIDADGDFSADAKVYRMSKSGANYIFDDIEIADGDFLSIVEIKPTVEFGITSASADESNDAVIDLVSNCIWPTDVTVEYSTANGSAIAGSDYTSASAVTATISAGTSDEAITIAVTDDATDESDETFTITISNPSSGLTIGTNNVYTHTINDNDITRKAYFAAATSSGSEATTSVNLNVQLSDVDNFNPTTVNYAVTGGTASNGTDYTLSSGTLTFLAGSTSENISVAVTNDVTDENDETLIVTLSNPTNCNLQSPYIHTYTITDNDDAPTVNFSAASSSGSESVGSATMTINLSAASAKTVTAYFSTSGTATSSTDYSITASPVVFSAGQTSKNLTVTVVNDNLVEASETVIATLTSATNGTLGSTTSHTYTINNDDNYGNAGPGGIGKAANLKLWVKSDDLSGSDGDRISTWSDMSGNGNNLTQSDNSFRPAYYSNVLNGFPVARFNQSYNRLIKNNFTEFPNNEITAIFVNKSSGESNDGVLSYAVSGMDNEYLLYSSNNLTIYRANNTRASSLNASDGNFNIVNSTWESTNDVATFYKNGTQTSSGAMTNTGAITQGGCLAVAGEQESVDGGYDDGQTFTGDFAELMLFNFVLNSAQNRIVTNYLSSKYDITTSNDIFAYDKDAATHPYYYHDLAGIGRVNSSNLHDDAKGEGEVRMYNPSSLGDGDYLLWAHDNVAIDGGTMLIEWTSQPADIQDWMKRIWRVDATGDVGTVDVEIDASELGYPGVEVIFYLLIDSDDGDFENSIKIEHTSFNDPYVTFEGVNFSDGDYFTLAYGLEEGSPLPVEYLNIEASTEENQVLVSWETASEMNCQRFEIEKSIDLKSWSKIGEVAGSGNSNVLVDYEFTDTKPKHGMNYYRLRQVDFDGNAENSRIVNAKIQLENEIEMFPNPANRSFTLKSALAIEGIKIFDNSMRMAFENENIGAYSTVIDLSTFKTGVYIVEIKTKLGIDHKKLIIERR